MVTWVNVMHNIEALDVEEKAVETLDEKKNEALQLNLVQMFRGLKATQGFISPRYSEDPFFKTRKQALLYAVWKKKISPDTDRPDDVPNLFINGRYHQSIEITADREGYHFKSEDKNAKDIEETFKEIYGLNAESREFFIDETLYPIMLEKVREIVKL